MTRSLRSGGVSLLLAVLLVASGCVALLAAEEPAQAAEPDSALVAVGEVDEADSEAALAARRKKRCRDPLGCINYKRTDPVVLGAALGLTGPFAEIGDGQLRAVEFAVAERSSLFGHAVVVHAADAACSPEGGADAAETLMADPLVVAVVGTTCSSAAFEAAPVVSEAGSVLVSPSNSAIELTGPGTRDVGYLRVFPSAAWEVEEAAALAAAAGHVTSAVVSDGVYGEIATQVFADAFAALGGTNLATIGVTHEEPDFGPVVAQLVAAGPPEAVFVLDVALVIRIGESNVESYLPDLLAAMAATPELAETVVVVSAWPEPMAQLISEVGELAEGILVVDVAAPSGPAYDSFATAYEDFHGVAATAADAYAYDAANVILDAIEEVGIAKNRKLQIGQQALRDALYSTSGFEGASGTITCDEFGDCALPTMQRFVVRNGELVPVEDGFVGLSVEAESCEYGGLLKRITAVDRLTVEFELCEPDVAIPVKVAFPAFGIHSQAYLEATGGTGDLITSPVGTGPYEFAGWGSEITLEPYANYWGQLAPAGVTLQWDNDPAARLADLAAGSADGIEGPDPADYAAIQGAPDLALLFRDPISIFYIGMNRDLAPFGDERVRQAMAMAVDRQRLVDLFYPEGTLVADQFLPPAMFGYTAQPGWYDHDPVAAAALLAEAGYPAGFEVTLTYRDVPRGYLPTPELVAGEIAVQLAAVGVDVTIEVMESGPFLDAIEAGELPFHLLGWTADWPDPTNMLDVHFGPEAYAQFGAGFPDIWDVLVAARSTADAALRIDLYQQAAELLKQHAPMIPVAHAANAVAFRSDVVGAHAAPIGGERFSVMDPGGRAELVFVDAFEPIGLYCGDESDGPSLRACVQVNEGLLGYEVGGTAVEPALATGWSANDDLTLWTFMLRDDVTFHDASDFDANDVVTSYVMMWDAAHPLHVGNTGSFTYFEYTFKGFLNDE